MRERSTQGLGDAAGMRAVTAFAAARQTINFFGSNIGSKPPQIWFQVNPDVIPRARLVWRESPRRVSWSDSLANLLVIAIL